MSRFDPGAGEHLLMNPHVKDGQHPVDLLGEHYMGEERLQLTVFCGFNTAATYIRKNWSPNVISFIHKLDGIHTVEGHNGNTNHFLWCLEEEMEFLAVKVFPETSSIYYAVMHRVAVARVRRRILEKVLMDAERLKALADKMCIEGSENGTREWFQQTCLEIPGLLKSDLKILGGADTLKEAKKQVNRACFLWHLYESTHHDLLTFINKEKQYTDAALCLRPRSGWPCPYEEHYPFACKYFWASKLPDAVMLLMYMPWFRKTSTTHGAVHLLEKALPGICHHRENWSILCNESSMCKKRCGICRDCRCGIGFLMMQHMFLRCSLTGGYPHSKKHPSLYNVMFITELFWHSERELFTTQHENIDKLLWFSWKEALIYYLPFLPSLKKDVVEKYQWDEFKSSTIDAMEYVRKELEMNESVNFISVSSQLYHIYKERQVAVAYKVIKDPIVSKLRRALDSLGVPQYSQPLSESLIEYSNGDPIEEMFADGLKAAEVPEDAIVKYETILDRYRTQRLADHAAKRDIKKMLLDLSDADKIRVRSAVHAFIRRSAGRWNALAPHSMRRQIKAVRRMHPQKQLNMKQISQITTQYFCARCPVISSVIKSPIGNHNAVSRNKHNTGLGVTGSRFCFEYDSMFCNRDHKGKDLHDRGMLRELKMLGSVWSVGKQMICLCEECGHAMLYCNASFQGNKILCADHRKTPDYSCDRLCCFMCTPTIDNPEVVPLKQPRFMMILDDYLNQEECTFMRVPMCARHYQRTMPQRTFFLMSDVLKQTWKSSFPTSFTDTGETKDDLFPDVDFTQVFSSMPGDDLQTNLMDLEDDEAMYEKKASRAKPIAKTRRERLIADLDDENWQDDIECDLMGTVQCESEDVYSGCDYAQMSCTDDD